MAEKTTKPKKLSGPQLRIIEQAKNKPISEILTESEGVKYAFVDGSAVHSGVVKRLIALGYLKPQGDGLFGFSQTYSA